MCTSENGKADAERCCIAHGPAPVSRVITRVETTHNAERQIEEEEEKGRALTRRKLRQKLHKDNDKLIIYPHTIYHLAIQESAP